MIYSHFWNTPLGIAHARCNENGLTYLMIDDQDAHMEKTDFIHPILKQAQQELNEYFEKKCMQFTVPIDPEGTNFQKQVWQALRRIPHGHTCNYQDIAKEIADQNASRAVGSACGANPILIIIPCHRVIQKSGKIGNFSAGLGKKTTLLKLEGVCSVK